MRGERTSVKLWRRNKRGAWYLNFRVPEDIARAYVEAYVRPRAEDRAEAHAKKHGKDIEAARAEARAKAYDQPKVLESLRTSDYAEALRERDKRLPVILERFTALRAAATLRRRDLSALSRAELEQLAMGYYREVLSVAKRRPIGGLTGSKHASDKVSRLSLKIFTDDLISPATEVCFFHNPHGMSATGIPVRVAMSQLDEWHGRFLTILRKQAL